MRKNIIQGLKKMVIKIGTSVLTTNAIIDRAKIERIVEDISTLLNKGIKVCLVSSGAISSGMSVLGLRTRPKNLPQLQATAAVGQRYLMDLYADAFQKHNRTVAQILLTQEDLRERNRYLNARNTIYTLLEKKIIPIINENDTVAVEEIKFGDNDRLSALVASLIGANLLIILSDVDGFYMGHNLLSTVKEFTPELEKFACGTKSKELCVGGMSTKLEAVKICSRAGIPCILANGNRPGILDKVISGENVGTLFLPQGKKLASRKQWILFNLKPKGRIYIDKGAVEAILGKGKSLLPAGIVKVEGEFFDTDLVSIFDIETKKEIAQGITNYAKVDLDKIKGLSNQEIEKVLGYKYYNEVIHRDNLVVL
ncbi:MAG: glutamate 5-kinase [Candidatus Omnitrophica bacterium]|nr:glutamate 5-kinase [Candidatus Omnitrophota bacterium]